MSPGISPRLRFRAAALLALLLPLCAAFAESRVRGTLSTNTASVGEAVELRVVVTGEKHAARPEVPHVDGFDISFAGAGERRSMTFGGSNSDFRFEQTFTYILVPKREGKFTIPALDVNVGGNLLKTAPATLTVNPGEAMTEAGDLAFAKISLPKKALYVGEVAPMEIRLYLDANARWELRSMPAQNGDGFTTRPFEKPVQREVQLEGKTYHLATFSTVITPGKAGKISIGPVPVSLVVSKPERGRPRFGFPFGGFESAQEMTVTAPELEIQVKPLPVEGRPKDFSGAIGKFEFEAAGTPDHVKIGEPVSMKLTIKGSGNFDRIGQPPLAEPDGWTTYSAKDNFQGSDSAGIEGVKTFELPVTPTARKTAMPVFAFSFFDPEAEKYVTLRSATVPLTVEGVPVVAAATPAPVTVEMPKAEAKPAVADILANLPDLGKGRASFGPRMSPAVFFGVMAAPLPILAALLVWRSRRRDEKALRTATMRKQKSALLARVRHATDRAEVIDAAAKAMQVQTALDAGCAETDADASALLASRKLDAETAKGVREIFEARNELLYAGAARGADSISERERDSLIGTLAAFEKSPRA
ncbi:MAG: BatD family protein [Chthoniobacteraceae bacterium]